MVWALTQSAAPQVNLRVTINPDDYTAYTSHRDAVTETLWRAALAKYGGIGVVGSDDPFVANSTSGRKLKVLDWPIRISFDGKREASIPNFFPTRMGYIIGAETRALFEKYDPGVHNYWPVELYERDGTEVDGAYWLFILGARLQTIDEERSQVFFKYSESDESYLQVITPTFDAHDHCAIMETPERSKFALENPAPIFCDREKIGSHNIWREDYFRGGAIPQLFVTDDFLAILQGHGLGALFPECRLFEF